MPDILGRITVPDIQAYGTTFPLVSDFGYGYTQEFPIVTHRFGTLDAKQEQRYKVGIGPRKFAFRRQVLSFQDRNVLTNFWEAVQGSYKSFLYNAPAPVGLVNVTWETLPLNITYLANSCRVGFNFVEVPSTTPTYSISATCTRFPTSALQTALLSPVQEIIPLVHIRVREAAVPDIYLSDRKCVVGGKLYLPRLLNLGERGNDVLISQDIKGTADQMNFTFGNADRVMTQLANDTDLRYAEIDLSFYHVGTGILLQFWLGSCVNFHQDGTPLFTLQASDGLYQINQMYPNRTISRTCWKTFNDGLNCPYATQGSGGNPNSCDFYFDSANGCVSHGMAPYFGGHPASPQGVAIKDNSTGVWGIGRNTVTATSIVSDTLWGNALQEIYCNSGGDPNQAFWVNGMIAEGRDESDFYDALVVVGQGPIGQYTPATVAQNADGFRYIVAPLLDGQPPHGFKVDGNLNIHSNNPFYGLRESIGSDPQTDVFALSAGGTVPGGFAAGSAAGTAFIEIRRTDPSGIQPTSTDQHSCQIPLNEGLSGWKWDQNGNRSLVPGLTNPYWIAVNTFLKAIGLGNADSDTQLSHFVLSSVFKGDGTGAAEIADLFVAPIVGTFNEVQFQFQGLLAQKKPYRDWLTEILACALGYYTWEFGKLKLGCRINASSVDTYTLGNILFQSLEMRPIEATFEHLIIEYADISYQYQTNTAEYQDKDHAAYYGRAGTPLTSNMHSVGICTLSQGLRIAATRTREEIGGINAAEWRNAREVTFYTTLLGLNNQVGQVISVTHPDVPGLRGQCNVSGVTVTYTSGDAFDAISMINKDILINGFQATVLGVSGNTLTVDNHPGDGNGLAFQIITADIRIESWSLCRDYSVKVTARTVVPSMYNLDVGPKPLDVIPDPLPAMIYPVPLGPVWAPYQSLAASFDALFPGEYSFDIDQDYITLADNSVLANLLVTGKLPVNSYSPNSSVPIIGSITVNPTGGVLGVQTLRLAVAGIDANGLPTGPSQIAIVPILAGNTNQVVLTNLVWPSNAVSYTLYASYQDDLICYQQSGALTDPITWNGPMLRSTYALPSTYVSKVRLKAKKGRFFGVTTGTVSAVTTLTVTISGLAGGTVNYTGRVLSVIGRADNSTPYLNLRITAHDLVNGILTVSPQAISGGDPIHSVRVGDVVVVRFQATGGNSLNPTQITDNAVGLLPGGEVGNLIRVVAGTGRGQIPCKITANTATTITWDLPLVMDTTSVWIIEEPGWAWTSDSTTIDNANPNSPVEFWLPISNFAKQIMLVSGFTIDIFGNESPDLDVPLRELWVYGGAPLKIVSVYANYTQQPTDVSLYVYTTNGPITIQLLPDDQWAGDLFILKVSSDNNTITILSAPGWSINGQASLTIVQSGIPYVLSPTNQTAVAITTTTGGSTGSGSVTNPTTGTNQGNTGTVPPPPPTHTLNTASMPSGASAALSNCSYGGTTTVAGVPCDYFIQSSNRTGQYPNWTSASYPIPSANKNMAGTQGISLFIGVNKHKTHNELYYCGIAYIDTNGNIWYATGAATINAGSTSQGNFGATITAPPLPSSNTGAFDPTNVASIMVIMQQSRDIDGFYVGGPVGQYHFLT